MDLKILGLALAGVLVALAGAGYAAGFFGRPMPFGEPHFANGTWNGTAPLRPEFNVTAAEDFRQAIASGNYADAMSLHQEYGFGGRLFDKLNETTFGEYSQIYNLSMELRQQLGINGTAPIHPPMGMGMRGFARPMRPERPF